MMNPKAVPKPGSSVADEALKLLTAFGGGDKELRGMLENMKEVQKHNEKVLEEAQETMRAANKAVSRMEADMVEIKTASEEYKNSVYLSNKELDDKKAEFDLHISTKEKSMYAIEHDLTERENKIKDRERNCSDQERYMATIEKAYDEREAEFIKKEKEVYSMKDALNKTFKNLRSIIPDYSN